MNSALLFGGLALFFTALCAAAFFVGALIQTTQEVALAPRFGQAMGKLLPGAIAHRYERLLRLAGSPRDMSVETLLGTKLLAAIGALVFMAALSGISAQPALFSPLILLIAMIAFSFIPDLWLSHKATDRQKRIRLDLPDTLDLLTINVEAGLSFDTAVARLVSNLSGPLVEELSRMLREMQLGRSRGEALRALMERTNIPELNSFVLAIIEADIFGISIGQTLRSQSRDMRTRRRQNAEQLAMKTPVKIIFPLILCIFPAILIVIVGPAIIRIVTILGGQ